jgi:hypothetical protein
MEAVTFSKVVLNRGTIIKISTACMLSQTSLKTVLGYHGEYCLFANRKLCGSDIRSVKYM